MDNKRSRLIRESYMYMACYLTNKNTFYPNLLKSITMKTHFTGRISTLIAGVLLMTSGALFSQTIEQAAEFFNQGKALITEGNNKAAIEKLDSCIKVCDLLEGEEAVNLKSQVTGVMPNLWYNYAKALYDQNLIDESIGIYKATLDVAKAYNNTEVYDKTRGALAQLYLKTGNDLYKAKDYTNAVSNLTTSLDYNPSNTSAMLIIAYSFKQLDSITQMIQYFQATIGAAEKNDKNAPKAKEGLMNYYMNTGARLLNQKNTADGLKYLDTAATYGESSDLLFYYAVGYNAEQKYDQAIVAAEKAIVLGASNKENVAKYNFEIGTAWYGKKDNAKACEYYKLANFGKTALRAEPMLKSLKCK